MTQNPILSSQIPTIQRDAAAGRLPGMQPIGPGDWLTVDGAYSAQLAEKARLIAAHRDKVIAILSGAQAAVSELLDVVLAELASKSDFMVEPERVRRPDGVWVALDRSDPYVTLSQLVVEDLCILQKQGEEHVLTAALLCFPAAWTLSEKIGRPLTGIHTPVAPYTDDIARRVQRLFDGVKVGRPLWRANWLRYDEATLFQPHTEAAPRAVGRPTSPFERSERQSVLRLAKSDAVVFSIHTTVIRRPDEPGSEGA